MDKRALVDRLEAVRERTLAIVAGLDTDFLKAQHSPLASPVLWDVGHIGAFEELWLQRHLIGGEASRDDVDIDDIYNAEVYLKPERADLPLIPPEEVFGYLKQVRSETLSVLQRLDMDASPLTRDGFVHEMIAMHEEQHQETVLLTLELSRTHAPERPAKPTPKVDVEGWADVPAGSFPMGRDRGVGSYDNEWPRHDVHVDAFQMRRGLVTNGEYLAFMKDGGYEAEDLWDPDGWLLRLVKKWDAPDRWERDGDGWRVREMGRLLDLPADQPVTGVSWYEADAYARWAGARLPTEAEWEKAASWDADAGVKRRFPWGDTWKDGHANVRQELYGPAPAGAYPDGASPWGIHQMAGDVWEWTSSGFSAYAGFKPFPYPEYSATHVDHGYMVLRGGSWAAQPSMCRTTFRNWWQPDHRHVYAGIRLARDAPEAS